MTGAGSGIGAATARRLAQDHNVIVADIDLEAAERVATEIDGEALRLDVSQRADWERIPPLDVLVNNAGITRDKTLLKMTDEDFQLVIDVHLKGMWLGCQHAVPHMKERGGGAIVNISSSGRHGVFGQSNYSAAKAGIVGLTKTVALEHARHGIRCNAVAPGVIDTPMTQNVPDHVREAWTETIALRRFGRPEEVAAAVVFLAGDDASYITGHVLDVTGLEVHP